MAGGGRGGSLWVRNDLITPYPHPNCYSSISDVPRSYGVIQAEEDLRRLPAQLSPTWGQPHTWLLLLPARRCLTRASARQRFSLGSDEQDVLSPGIYIAMGRCGISVEHPWAEVSAPGTWGISRGQWVRAAPGPATAVGVPQAVCEGDPGAGDLVPGQPLGSQP